MQKWEGEFRSLLSSVKCSNCAIHLWLIRRKLTMASPPGQGTDVRSRNDDSSSVYSCSEDGDRDSTSREHELSSNTTATTDIEENYYSQPLDDSTLTTVDEIEAAIDQVKALVLETQGVSDERKKLVKRLIDLRLRLQDVRDVTNDNALSSTDELRIVQQHHFIVQKQALHLTAQYCDRCSGVIWTVLQYYYKCKACQYQCHVKCLNQVVRFCQAIRVTTETSYLRDICPEVGLHKQNYQCAECSVHFTLKNSWMEPRRCDYDGRYYCPLCHRNSTASVPARILHNWDFEERRVCDASRQFLILMSKKPNIHLEKINPKLFSFVEELNAVKRLREEIIIIKEYFMTCREAINQKLLRLLQDRQHFVENSYMYSLQDLIDVNNGTLVKYLTGIHGTFIKHIREECQTCLGKGFICEICENVQVIFPFDPATQQCPRCHTVFHNICYAKRESCPKCVRRRSRILEGSTPTSPTTPTA